MSLRRAPSILQSVVQMRNWLVEHVPGTDSMLGYDLFLKLGNDAAHGQTLRLSEFARGLPYALDAVAGHLQRFETAGMVALTNDADHGLMLQATPRFITLLDQYSIAFESKFIVRDELRGQQLVVQSEHPELANLARVLYDRMYDMGWLYLHNFGSACFLMASLVRRLAELHGRQARVASCYVEIARHTDDKVTGRFLLGGQGFAKAGQIDGHAACVIDEKLIVDFGLGSARKDHRRDFPWGAICDYERAKISLGRLVLPDGETMTWRDDWQSPGSDAELARYAPHLDGFVAQYLARFH